MVQGHQDAITMLTNAEGQLSSPVKDLVTNLLPTVRQHEMTAVDLEKVKYITSSLFRDAARIAQIESAPHISVRALPKFQFNRAPVDTASSPAAIGRWFERRP